MVRSGWGVRWGWGGRVEGLEEAWWPGGGIDG